MSADLPPLRLLLIMDNLAGHKTRGFEEWLFAHGVLPLYTPLSGPWLNMTESVQRIISHRALDGAAPASPEDIITGSKRPPAAGTQIPRPSSVPVLAQHVQFADVQSLSPTLTYTGPRAK